MKLTTRARYALHCMLAVARLGTDGRPVSLDVVANHTGLSKRYLEQLAIALKHAHLLRGISGRGGGYVLGRETTEIRLGEIVEATIGPISIVDCVADPTRCEKAGGCETRAVYRLVNRAIRQMLDRFTLSDLASRERLAELVEEFGLDGADELSCDGEGPVGPCCDDADLHPQASS